MSMLRDQAARRRLELNPITTSSLSVHHGSQPHQTPSSALSANSLSAQFGYNPATYTPLSAVREYNPQQWASSPSVHSDHSHSHSHSHAQQQFATARPQDPEVVTPAPPPYSPPRNQHSVTAEETASASPATRISPINAYRSSPEPSSNAVFNTPPPPPNRPRLAQERPQSLYYHPSSVTQRAAPEISHLSPNTGRDHVLPPLRSPSLQPPSMRHQNFGTDHSHSEEHVVDSRPPASRRAASTGAISSTPSSSRSRGSSTSRWEPGMPLPPPPPGPPPASRSQSMNRSTDVMVSPPTRRPPHLTSSLGPVPPTPAGWVDEDIRRGKSPNRGLQIDTSSVSLGAANPDSNSGSSSSGLTRHHAIKGESKSIRERRSESKSGKRIAVDEPSNNPWAEAISPSEKIVSPLTILGRRPTITKSTHRNSRSYSSETPKTGETSSHSTPIQCPPSGIGSRGSTPRQHAPTPPFSPGLPMRVSLREASPAIPPKALPTPNESPAQPMSIQSMSQSNKMTSRQPAPAPLNLSRPASRQSMSDMIPASPAEHFARAAIERHQAFSQKESNAKSDGERVRIFAEFIVTESRIRRERYSSAIDAMGSEILELTRDLFRPYNNSRRESTVSKTSGWTPESSSAPGTRSRHNSVMASQHESPQLQSEHTPASGSVSPALVAPDTTWWNNYKPSLSPIPSMSVSEAPDGSDSRGRPSSRWWEISDVGSQGQSSRLERSKRESKYMGVPRELREKLQYDGDGGNSGFYDVAGPSNQRSFGPDEYPPEKMGLIDQNLASPSLSQVTAQSPAPFSPPLFTPNPNHLDVSRLVTLPPPYPRHHPAVNNNHPDLTSIRTTVRSLSNFTEVEATKKRFTVNLNRIREENEAAATKRRTSLRASIQQEIESGKMTFADAAQAEASAALTEREKTMEAATAEFNLFNDQVVAPLNGLFKDRIIRSGALFEQLRGQLKTEAQAQNPNSTQEEGDEQPELLEKLTLLKWIFEAREGLHRELYDVMTERNDRYKEMVVTPYRLSNNLEKMNEATGFFAADSLQRKLQNEQEILKRTEDFMDAIERHVSKGVEALLNAFWDIAPGLSRITAKVPSNLEGFGIQIPREEYEENPSYYTFPMQYLYSLLSHCEKSTYQFIESQTNLLCLLHEVKSGVTAANCRLMRTQRISQGEREEVVELELSEVERDEEIRLTDDLKEKVRCVEDLWSTGLGTELKSVKERIGTWLVEQGGWMDDE